MSNWYPELIPINREEDYHTHYLGETAHGNLFFGYETFVFPNRHTSENWLEDRLEYVLVYLFTKDGDHIDTRYRFLGKTNEMSETESGEVLLELLKDLGTLEFKNIKVRPFRSVIDGIEFGLIPNEESQMVELQPSSTIVFSEPWDGEYYT